MPLQFGVYNRIEPILRVPLRGFSLPNFAFANCIGWWIRVPPEAEATGFCGK
jgi:hypothetical protein